MPKAFSNLGLCRRQLQKNGDKLLVNLDARAFFLTSVTEWEMELNSQASSRLYSYPVTTERDAFINNLVRTVNCNKMSETSP
jgi:hypothetical protein